MPSKFDASRSGVVAPDHAVGRVRPVHPVRVDADQRIVDARQRVDRVGRRREEVVEEHGLVAEVAQRAGERGDERLHVGPGQLVGERPVVTREEAGRPGLIGSAVWMRSPGDLVDVDLPGVVVALALAAGDPQVLGQRRRHDVGLVGVRHVRRLAVVERDAALAERAHDPARLVGLGVQQVALHAGHELVLDHAVACGRRR